MSKAIYIFVIFAFHQTVFAQDELSWSLQKCINYAIKNSLTVEQAKLGVGQAKLAKKQAVWSQTPRLNGSFSFGYNFGRSVDPTSYSFINQVTNISSLGVNLNQTIFQGLTIRNSIKQSKIDYEAAEKDVEQAKNDVALAVAQSYLSILLASENLDVFVEQAKVTKAQYDQTLKMIKAGVLAENSKFDLEAQMARDEENIVNAQNTLDLSYVNLKVLMNMDVSEELIVQEITDLVIPESLETYTLDELYQEALNAQPNITAAKLREQSADMAVKIAKGALWPTISFYGSVNTNFSSAARFFEFASFRDTLSGVVSGSTDQVEVYRDNYYSTQGDVIPYFTQLGGNIYSNIGVSLSIPIFNSLQARINIERAKLGVLTSKLATKQIETTLKTNIKTSLTDVLAAEKRYFAASKTLESTRMSVVNTRKRYDLGVVNSFELTSVQNTLLAIESNLLQAKYDYLFKIKILDYYRGKMIDIK